VSNHKLAKYIEKNLNFDQLILECWDGVDPNSGWVHVSYVGENVNRKDVLTYSKETGYTKGIE
jgi:zinc D-Ala-D-Ala carboxypeptidase